MKIILGETSGFCFGAGEAIKKAEKIISENKSGEVYCLGDIVHNKQVVDEFKNKGMKFINDIDEIEDDDKNDKLEEKDKKTLKPVKLIIRAHGIEKKIYEKAKKRNIELLDYSCPNVLAIHKIVEEYVNKGYYLLLLGEKNHPETIGTISFAKDKNIVLKKEEDIKEVVKKLKNLSVNKLLIVAQTTFSSDKFNKYIHIIKEELEKDNKNIIIEVKNTVCNATKLRQEETEQISSCVDYMIIIGGKKSANSIKLYEIAKEHCGSTVFIETYKDIEGKINEICKFDKIGIMAGASTPQKSIDDVINLLNSQKIHKS